MIRDAVGRVALAGVLAGASLALAGEGTGGWPAFHGPGRDGISAEKGLLKRWPEGGPRRVWTFEECGRGYACVTVADGMIFTAGDFGNEEMILALNLDGKLLWKAPNGRSWRGSTPGSRSTPTYDEGVLYHLNPTGRLAAYRARSGEPVWVVDLRARFDAKFGAWALAESVVIDGDKVLCVPGGRGGRVVGLDKRTGETIWANTTLRDTAAYCSPVLATYKGVRMLITLMRRSVVAVDAETGAQLWTYPIGRPIAQNATTPVFQDGYVFIASGHSSGGTLLKINPDLRGVTKVWYREDFDNCHGGVILVNGRLYGGGCRLGGKAFFCIDFLTGRTRHSDLTVGKVSITYADGMLYCLHHEGKMLLIEITPEGFDVVSAFDLPTPSENLHLAYPVVCGGRLYVRYDRWLYAWDIRAK